VEQLLQILEQIRELAGVAIEGIQGAAGGGAPPEGEAPPEGPPEPPQ
jgi:hypothetical protein